MASTNAFTDTDIPLLTPNRPSSRFQPCFSLSPSLSPSSSFGSSSFPDSPSTPFRSSGIPFSWELLPGVPKKSTPEQKECSSRLLPLPPAAAPAHSKKFNTNDRVSPNRKKRMSNGESDPFFAALVECSKDDHDPIGTLWTSSKVTRTLSDRFGFFNMYTSCKSICDVSESIVPLPRYKHM